MLQIMPGVRVYLACRPVDMRRGFDRLAQTAKDVVGVDPQQGGYVSFACRWVPYGANERPLRTLN